MSTARLALVLFLGLLFPSHLRATDKIPPYDLWTPRVLSAIRDRTTLEYEIQSRTFYADVFYTSNASASWYDSEPPYERRANGRIRIHGYLAAPLGGGPYPALVIGHGHGGQADLAMALQVAALGYVALAIDGPMAGQSTGGPRDTNQAWISVDSGPDHGFLYHYAYAGMRALTLLETLAAAPGNPYRIDAARLGVLGASMGGLLTSYMNGIDNRVKAAVILAAAGQWAHSLRFPNSWLYHGLYTGTRDQPYNNQDPLNSIEDIDTDPTAATFMNYFDPVRYAPRQYAPVLMIIGTHDGYFPLTCANQMFLGITSAGIRSDFEKRLWLVPNAPHSLGGSQGLLQLVEGLRQWLEFSFGRRDKPLAAPAVALTQVPSGLRFEVTLAEPASRLAPARAVLHAATRVDANATPIRDFKPFDCTFEGDRFVAVIPSGDLPPAGDPYSADNVIYFATVTAASLPVSSVVYRAGRMIDLSSGFVPGIDPYAGPSSAVPGPPSYVDARTTLAASAPVRDESAYQGMSLANPADRTLVVRMEALSEEGRIAAAEGLLNPVFMPLAPGSQRVFLAEEWMGPGARHLSGSFRFGWSNPRGSSLAFAGNVAPPELTEIGPLEDPATRLWLPLVPEQDGSAPRSIRFFSAGAAAAVTVILRSIAGDVLETRRVNVPASGSTHLSFPAGQGVPVPAMAEILASAPVSARLEVKSARDSWGLEARPAMNGPRYIQPHVEWNGVFMTRVVIVNPSSTATPAVLRLRTASGAQVTPERFIDLPGFSTAGDTVESLFGLQGTEAAGAGWLEIVSADGPLVVTALAIEPKGGAAAASPVLPAASGTWSMPFFVEDPWHWTGLAILNPEDSPLSLEIAAYDTSGNLIAKVPLLLAARQGRTQLVAQWIPALPPESTGQIVISAAGNLSLLAYFGTDDGLSLAAVPFSRLPP